jgi:hypothetical protein
MTLQGDQSARGFAAGVFIGLAVMLPVFAATTPELEQWALPLMFAATVLLVVGITTLAMGLGEVNRDAPKLAVRGQAARPRAIQRERRAPRHLGHAHAHARQLG